MVCVRSRYPKAMHKELTAVRRCQVVQRFVAFKLHDARARAIMYIARDLLLRHRSSPSHVSRNAQSPFAVHALHDLRHHGPQCIV